ncbi:hypothetical protein [Methanothermococcus sp.]|nr:hypothetical protein [Methanothermococcus sp.]
MNPLKRFLKEHGRDYKAVLNFVHEVQEVSGKNTPTLEGII